MWQAAEKNLCDKNGKNVLDFNEEANDTTKGSKILSTG